MGDGGAAAVAGLGLCEKRTVSRAGYGMKPRPIIEKPPNPWSSFYSSNSIALDRLVEVALSSTDVLDFSCRDNVATRDEQFPNLGNDRENDKSSTTPRSNGEGDVRKDDDSAERVRYCNGNVIKGVKQAAIAPSPSSGTNNNPPAGYYQQQQQQQKLKRRLSVLSEISPPAGRSSSSLRVHADHAHSKRFTPRFKSLLDISC